MSELRKKLGRRLWHYTLIGFLFGSFFPLIAYYMSLSEKGRSFGISNIIQLHQESNLYYIIDLAPLVIGLLFSIIGRGTLRKIRYLISIAKIEKELRDEKYDAARTNSLGKIRRVYLRVIIGALIIIVGGNLILIGVFNEKRNQSETLTEIGHTIQNQFDESNSLNVGDEKDVVQEALVQFNHINEAHKTQLTRYIFVVSMLILFAVTMLIYAHFFLLSPGFIDLQKGVYETTIAKRKIQEQGKENQNLLDQLNLNMDTAKFIQGSLNQSVQEMKEFFADSFIINRPLQVLSGDYVWFKKISEDKALICLGDCVGHGVAGSLLSTLYITFLDSISKIETQPDKIIECMDLKMKEHLKKNNVSTDDFTCEAGVIMIDRSARSLFFAGSNTELMIQNGGFEIIKSQRFSIGSHRRQEKIELQEFILDENAWFILCSDGFKNMLNADQARLGYKGVEKLLSNYESEAGEPYREKLSKEIDEYLQNSVRNDDILITGIKI